MCYKFQVKILLTAKEASDCEIAVNITFRRPEDRLARSPMTITRLKFPTSIEHQ